MKRRFKRKRGPVVSKKCSFDGINFASNLERYMYVLLREANFIIECKGRANESFPIRWKMFKKHVKDNLKHVTLYKPQNQNDCNEVIKLILNKIK